MCKNFVSSNRKPKSQSLVSIFILTSFLQLRKCIKKGFPSTLKGNTQKIVEVTPRLHVLMENNVFLNDLLSNSFSGKDLVQRILRFMKIQFVLPPPINGCFRREFVQRGLLPRGFIIDELVRILQEKFSKRIAIHESWIPALESYHPAKTGRKAPTPIPEILPLPLKKKQKFV